MSISKSYTQEEIQEILQLATARQFNQGDFSREQLKEIAAELAISPESLAAAEQEWLRQKPIQQKRHLFDLYRQQKVKAKVSRYLVVNGFFLALNQLSSGHLSWSLYILLFWGLGLALYVVNDFFLQGEAYEQALSKWEFGQDLKRSINKNIFGKN